MSRPPLLLAAPDGLYRFAYRDSFRRSKISSRGRRRLLRNILSKRQQAVAQGGVIAQLGGRAAVADIALLQHIDAVGEGEREIDALLGQQDRQTLHPPVWGPFQH